MKIIKLNAIPQFLIYAGTIALLGCSASLFASEKNIETIKNEISELQEILLNPKQTQIAVLLSVTAKSNFTLDSVSLYFDTKKTKTYLYTKRESNALINNAVQKIYIENLSKGEHTIYAQFSAMDEKNKKYNVRSSAKFTKTHNTKYVELNISKSEQQETPELNINIWE